MSLVARLGVWARLGRLRREGEAVREQRENFSLGDAPKEEKRCDHSLDCGRDSSKKTNPSHLMLMAISLVARGIAVRFECLRALAMRARLSSNLDLERQKLVVIAREVFGEFETHGHDFTLQVYSNSQRRLRIRLF